MTVVKAPTPVPNPTLPYWIKAFPNAIKPITPPRTSSWHGSSRPKLPETADVVIIGAGIAGVSAAYHLRKTRPDLQVVLLEARQLSHGATGRNGGLLWPALNAPWIKTAERYGTAEASRMMAFELQCLAEVQEFIEQQGLGEEVRHAVFTDGGFYVYEGQQEMEAELAELELMQKCGIHRDVVPLSRRELSALLGSGAFVGATRQPGVSRVWAARLVHAIARLAAAAGPEGGLVLAEDTRVQAVTPLRQEGEAPLSGELDPSSNPLLEVTTAHGQSLLARRVVHCTNAYSSSLLPELSAALVPVRNHVAATKSPHEVPGAPHFPLDAAFFARSGYVYWSRREDGRVVVGGFRDVLPDMDWGVYDDSELDERVRQQLHAYLPERFPDVFGAGRELGEGEGAGRLDAEAEWSGILGFTQDRFPFVGPVPGRRGQFLAAGFSGHGMTRTFTCGRVLADMVTGAPPDPAFPATWLPSEARFGPAMPAVPGASGATAAAAATGPVYVTK